MCVPYERDDAADEDDAADADAALAMQLMINCTALGPVLRMLQVHSAPPS